MRFVLDDETGLLSLQEQDTVYPGPDDIRIKVVGSGINRADLLQKQGKYPPPPGASATLGLEVAGVVDAIGSKVKNFQIGDHVMGLLAGGGYAESVADHADLFMPIPKSTSLIEAAGIPEAFLTSYQVLFQLGQLKPNESVLIHAGASGVGSAAIQLAKAIGSTVYTTVGSEEKTTFCKQLGADAVVNYRLNDFEQIIHNQGGVDLVIDVVGGNYFQKNINVLKTDGRYIVVAFMGGAKVNVHLGQILTKRIRLQGTTLRARSIPYKKQLIQDFLNQFNNHLTSGKIRPIIDQVFPITSVNEAHDYMEKNLNKGKIVLSWGDPE